MLTSFKKLFFSMGLLALTSATAFAYNISGRIVDNNSEALPDATIRLLSARDSSYITGATSNSKGFYRISNVKSGKYILQCTFIGYDTTTKDVTVAETDVRVRPIAMTESSILLKEITATGVKTQIKVKEDTIEFNADSYKTQPNAVVEDLLKRLPGVEVGSDGKITANGKEVKKILVDGKEFFSDDPKVATKNLPVDMVDKLQVVDRQSDLARLTGVDDGEEETVINLTVKKGMNNGWFGSAEVGYGTDDRYKGGFIVNRFWDGNQITIIGSANNINELGFTDGNSGRFRRFGGDNGITTSQTLGINFNVGNEEIFRVGGNVMYSHTDRNSRQTQNRQYLFADSTSYEESAKRANDAGHNIRADFRMKWEPDEYNTFEFKPRVSFNFNDSESLDSTLTLAGNYSRVNKSFNSGISDGKSFEFSGQLVYNHKFSQRKGRSFSVQAQYSLSNVREDEYSYSLNRFFLLNDSIDEYLLYTDNHTWSNNVNGRLTWTEPLGDPQKGHFLTFAYRANYRWNNADKIVSDYPVEYGIPGEIYNFDHSLLVFNDSLSNQFRNEFFNQDIRLGYRFVRKTINLNAGLTFVPSMTKSDNLLNHDKDLSRWVWNFAPFLRFRYKINDASSFNINYQGRTSQPSINQLQPVADKSNPMRVVVGNPNLDPTFSHNIRVRFQDFNADTQRSLMLMANAQVSQNSIISVTSFDPTTGGQTTTYTNVNGVWNARLMNMVSLPFRDKRWSFNNNIFGFYNQTIGYNNTLRNRSGSLMVSESFSIAFRPDHFEFELRPFYNLQTTRNSVQTNADRNVHTYGGAFNGAYYTPWGLTINTDLSYSGTQGYSDGYDTNQWMWNASISYQFLRDKAATISLKVYDLLQQKENIRRNVTANYIDDINYNSLTRYFMLSFNYKFNTFGKGNQPKGRGPGGPFPGGRPPGHSPRAPRF